MQKQNVDQNQFKLLSILPEGEDQVLANIDKSTIQNTFRSNNSDI